MGLQYNRATSGKPNCYESPEVQLLDGVRDIPFTGSLVAYLVPTDSAQDCQLLGVILDEQGTLIVDCLHAEEEVLAFHRTCRDNSLEVSSWGVKIAAPCPPPENQLQVATWAASLFQQLSGGGR
jgi:hypothetical protein